MAELGSIQIDAGDLSEAVRSLADAVRYQGDTLTSLMKAASAEADALNEQSFGPTKLMPVQQHGFARGDKVVLFNGDGTLRFATLPQDSKRFVYSEKLPVDLDNGQTDAWPVKLMLKVDANTQQYIDKLSPPVPFGMGVPPTGTDRNKWNAAALKIAVEEELTAEFTYEKPPSSVWDTAKPKHQRVKPVRFDGLSSTDPSRQAILAVDLQLPSSAESRFRTFRLDRITSTVSVY